MAKSTNSPEFLAQYKKAYGSWAGNNKGHPPDFERCAEEISSDRYSMMYHQCSRKNGHGPHGAWCKQHDPDAVKKRRDAQYQKWRAEWAERDRKAQFAADCKDAIRQIAAGHNDPRGLAQSIIDKLEQDT